MAGISRPLVTSKALDAGRVLWDLSWESLHLLIHVVILSTGALLLDFAFVFGIAC